MRGPIPVPEPGAVTGSPLSWRADACQRSLPELSIVLWGGLARVVWEFAQSPLYADHGRSLFYVLQTPAALRGRGRSHPSRGVLCDLFDLPDAVVVPHEGPGAGSELHHPRPRVHRLERVVQASCEA